MKRLFAILLLSCMMSAVSFAAPAGTSIYDAPLLQLEFELVDSPYAQGAEFGPVIMRITAPGGQMLHVVTSVPSQAAVHSMDVNFDGVDDLAVMVSSGATNSVFRLFVKQGERYVAVDDGQEEGLFNPVFYPALGLVESQGTSGLAGALHESTLLRWEGTRLVPLRRAVCENRQTMENEADSYTVITWINMLHSRVMDYTDAKPGEPAILFEESYDMEAQGMEDAYDAFYKREQEALWQGIAKP